MLRCFLLLSLLLHGVASGQSQPLTQPQPSSQILQKFFSEFFEEQLRDEPEFATSIGRHEYDDRWTDWSKSGREARREHIRHHLEQLWRFPLDGIPEQDRLSVRLLEYELRQRLEAEDLETHLLSVSQLFGLHNVIYLTVDRMPGRTVHDYQNIIARIRGVPAYVDQFIALANEAIQRGLVQPRLVGILVANQTAAQSTQDQAHTPLLAAFRRFPSNIPADEQLRLRTEAQNAYEQEFLPAWRKLHEYLVGSYARDARYAIGLSAIPGGREAYAVLVRRFTTISMTPEEIHQIGEKEVRRIETDMQGIARETGFTGTLEEFERKLASSPEQHFGSKEEMLEYCRNIAKIVEPELPTLFKNIPVLLYGVRAIPEDREQATATYAQPPTPDASAPGWFNLNTYRPEKQSKFVMEPLVLHEAVPGHIFQLSLAQTLRNIPDFRRFYGNSAYLEGWALYSESLGGQLGVYRDAYSRFGQLSSERFRAVRLVVDTGIHAFGWTREQALDYFRRHAPDQQVAEIDRYIAWPGQALAYKTGQLKILELRREAEQRLGPKFDIRDFHDFVLRNGVLPLELLQEQTREYVAARAGK